MKRLEDIPKKNIFEVPDGYFDKLPLEIQSKTTIEAEKNFVPQWSYVLRYALPIVILAVVGIFWYQSSSQMSILTPEQELESVSEDQLSLYLNDADLSTEELVETMTWSEEDLNDLEEKVFDSFEVTSRELEDVLDEF